MQPRNCAKPREVTARDIPQYHSITASQCRQKLRKRRSTSALLASVWVFCMSIFFFWIRVQAFSLRVPGHDKTLSLQRALWRGTDHSAFNADRLTCVSGGCTRSGHSFSVCALGGADLNFNPPIHGRIWEQHPCHRSARLLQRDTRQVVTVSERHA